jgi:hypothetical protein
MACNAKGHVIAVKKGMPHNIRCSAIDLMGGVAVAKKPILVMGFISLLITQTASMADSMLSSTIENGPLPPLGLDVNMTYMVFITN